MPPKLAVFVEGPKRRSVCRASSQGVLFLDGSYVTGCGNSNMFGIFSPNSGENEQILTSIFFKGGWFNHQLGKINVYHGPDVAG